VPSPGASSRTLFSTGAVIGRGAFWGAGIRGLGLRLSQKAVGEGRALASAAGCKIGALSQQQHHLGASPCLDRGVRSLVVGGGGGSRVNLHRTNALSCRGPAATGCDIQSRSSWGGSVQGGGVSGSLWKRYSLQTSYCTPRQL
jgi:hypothetical protein